MAEFVDDLGSMVLAWAVLATAGASALRRGWLAGAGAGCGHAGAPPGRECSCPGGPWWRGCLVAWSFSIYVVQAGSARAGLPRQRSTELVRSSGRPGESC